MLRRHAIHMLFVAFLLIGVRAVIAQTPVGSTFAYQGLLDSNGFPATGIYDFRFSLWDSAGSGSPPAGGTQISGTICSDNVTVTDGLFITTLDFGPAAFNGDARWLQIGVRLGGAIGNCDSGTYTTLAPRQRLNSAPYAQFALAVKPAPGLDGHSLNAADGSPQNALIVDNAGNVGVGVAAPLAALHVVAPGANGVALYAVNTATAGSGAGAAVEGICGQAGGFAFGGVNSSLTGTGLVVAGNNQPLAILGTGSGAAIIGDGTGLYADSESQDAAEAIYCEQYGDAVRVAAWTGQQFAKVIGAGSVSTIVNNVYEQPVTMFCPESPEVLFTDYGAGQLAGGFVHIELDPTFAKNVLIDEKHPLRVFVQLEENEKCAGVVVKNKTAHGFDVVELAAGRSNTPFQYQVTCNRADEKMARGRVSHYADARFPPAPPKIEKLPVALAPDTAH